MPCQSSAACRPCLQLLFQYLASEQEQASSVFFTSDQQYDVPLEMLFDKGSYSVTSDITRSAGHKIFRLTAIV